MTLTQSERLEALYMIGEIQRGGDSNLSGTARVRVAVGGVSDSGQVEHDTLYLEEAPDRILQELRDAGFSLSVDDDGVQVEDFSGD